MIYINIYINLKKKFKKFLTLIYKKSFIKKSNKNMFFLINFIIFSIFKFIANQFFHFFNNS